ncbi:hypothetical protein PIB30_037114 [Stylosanthes scabra]|uniref:Uncharacterized protein n=1 Tax=Stylosanthes scabra TaxID=79078 RepID=A0ABU6YCA3_9FABA|nr:hypothetical protein [Stylosanthes scabra]
MEGEGEGFDGAKGGATTIEQEDDGKMDRGKAREGMQNARSEESREAMIETKATASATMVVEGRRCDIDIVHATAKTIVMMRSCEKKEEEVLVVVHSCGMKKKKKKKKNGEWQWRRRRCTIVMEKFVTEEREKALLAIG